MISLSLNEVESLASKAARGAGLSWGLAEDIGRAARRMAEAGIGWVGPITRLAGHGSDATIGAKIADEGQNEPIVLPGVFEPALIASLAAANPIEREANWPGARIAMHAGRLVVLDGKAIDDAGPVGLEITRKKQLERVEPARSRAAIQPEELQHLERLGAQTYVPASLRSRATGAGAGLTDND